MHEPAPTGRPFLTARWSNLFLASYTAPPELLRPRLPPGLDLDTRDGQAFVSLVAFDFLDTRVFGVPWPGYRNFPELNLRYYVRRGDERGVVFVREFVPPRLVAWLAHALYNEPYVAAGLTSAVRNEPERLSVEYRLTFAGRVHTLAAAGAKPPFRPAADSVESFFKEHRWGYGRTRRGRTTRYEVRHTPWDVFPVTDYRIELNWEAVYGAEWRPLQKSVPVSTVLAVGSAVAVYPKGVLPA